MSLRSVARRQSDRVRVLRNGQQQREVPFCSLVASPDVSNAATLT